MALYEAQQSRHPVGIDVEETILFCLLEWDEEAA